MKSFYQCFALRHSMRERATNFRSLVVTPRAHIVAALIAACALLGGALPASAAWEHAHGDSANTGFARVDTAPAARPKLFAPLGLLAPGANPVIGPDGTLYIGNLAGELRAFHADGTPYWTRKINSTHGQIYASPVVGADGSIYAVSVIIYNDHRGGALVKRAESYLHKFTPGGAWLFARQFPEQFPNNPYARTSGAAAAPPNIWRANGIEAVMAPVVYRWPGERQVRLIALSTSGSLLADRLLSHETYDVTGPSFCESYWCPFGFNANYGPAGLADAGWPMPGVAIGQNPKGGTPIVVVSDGYQDTAGYTFSPSTGFTLDFHARDTKRDVTSPPVLLPDGHTAIGTGDNYHQELSPAAEAPYQGRLTFTRPNLNPVPTVGNLGLVTAAPTRMADGRLVVIERQGRMTLINGSAVVQQGQLVGASIASAAASCTHLFVATTDELVSFDVNNMMPVARVPWVGGGRAAPVIGPSGHVYAIASNSLFVFAPPLKSRVGGVVGRTACDRLAGTFGATLAR